MSDHLPECPIRRETWCIWPGDRCGKCDDLRNEQAEMTKPHLPECPISIGDIDITVDGTPMAAIRYCACSALRACEERVEESMDRAWEKVARDQFDAGYSAAMNDSREALAEIVDDKDAVVWFERFYENPDDPDEKTSLIELNRAISAIDALREASDD